MLINTYTLEIKKSKFIALYYEVNNKEEVELILTNLKKEHKKAKHFPYAYKINNDIKKSDDKEPSGTSGMPILNIILKNNLDRCVRIPASGNVRALNLSNCVAIVTYEALRQQGFPNLFMSDPFKGEDYLKK